MTINLMIASSSSNLIQILLVRRCGSVGEHQCCSRVWRFFPLVVLNDVVSFILVQVHVHLEDLSRSLGRNLLLLHALRLCAYSFIEILPRRLARGQFNIRENAKMYRLTARALITLLFFLLFVTLFSVRSAIALALSSPFS